jgi:murein DD-endopeptidase MepM/ murein hydrolase activator NlpD
MSGTVEVAGWHNSYGNYVIIKHKDHYQTLYGHMSKILTTKGAKINQGDVVGLVGTTGYSTGPHLHFEIRQGGKAEDPRNKLNIKDEKD